MNYFSILTSAGLTKLIKASANNQNIVLNQMGVSDDRAEITQDLQTLPNEKHKFNINSITQSKDDANVLICEGVIASEIGGFYIRKVGVYSDDGVLFAVGIVPESYKPLLAEGSAKDITIKFYMQVDNTANITLKVDNNVVLATRTFVNDEINKLNQVCLKKGEFGIGLNTAPLISNLDDTTIPAGFYRTQEDITIGTFPPPWNNRSAHANVLIERLDMNWIKQTVTHISNSDTPSIWYRTNNFPNGWNAWKRLVAGEVSSKCIPNTIVIRDESNDFEGRFISADHFRLKTPTQNNLFGANNEILFRGGASQENNHVRAVSGLYALKALLSAQSNSIAFQGISENKDEAGQASFGYVRLPGGLILQFGITHRMHPQEKRTQYFPMTFPNACYTVLASAHMPIPNDGTRAAQSNAYDNAKCELENHDANSSMHIAWIAIGA